MSKRFIISEDERKYILSKYNLLNEQPDSPKHISVRGIQRFLNEKIKAGLEVDGLTDNNLKSKTAQAIAKYQRMLRVNDDGIFEEDTWNAMNPKDKQRLEDLIAEEGGVIDMFFNWMKKNF